MAPFFIKTEDKREFFYWLEPVNKGKKDRFKNCHYLTKLIK